MIIRDFLPEDVANLHDIFDDETMENCEPAYVLEITKDFFPLSASAVLQFMNCFEWRWEHEVQIYNQWRFRYKQYILNFVYLWAIFAGHVVHADTFTPAESADSL